MGIIDDIVQSYKENGIEVDKTRKLDQKVIRSKRLLRPRKVNKKE